MPATVTNLPPPQENNQKQGMNGLDDIISECKKTTIEETSSVQLNQAEKSSGNITDNRLTVPGQTNGLLLASNIKNHIQPARYIVHPTNPRNEMQSFNPMVAPENVTFPGPQQVQTNLPSTIPLQSMPDHDSLVSNQPYQLGYPVQTTVIGQNLQTISDMQVYHQYHPSQMAYQQHQQNSYIPRFRPMYGYAKYQEPHYKHQNRTGTMLYQRPVCNDDNNNNSLTHSQGNECNYTYLPVPSAENTTMAKQELQTTLSKPKNTNNIKNTMRANITTSTATESHTEITKCRKEANNENTEIKDSPKEIYEIFTQKNTSQQNDDGTASSSLETTDDEEWCHRDKLQSSDSGWVSENGSNKGDGELGDDAASVVSPTLEEMSECFQDTINLESSRKSCTSSADEIYQESRLSSLSSRYPSSTNDIESRPIVKKKHSQQTRIMRPIPARFLNLLKIAAENAEKQRKRLEGCPLFKQVPVQRYDPNYTLDHMYSQSQQGFNSSSYPQGPSSSQNYKFCDEQYSAQYGSPSLHVLVYVVNVDGTNLANQSAVYNGHGYTGYQNYGSQTEQVQGPLHYSNLSLIPYIQM